MAKRNKKKKVISEKKDEYDLKSSLNKLRQRGNSQNSETSTKFRRNSVFPSKKTNKKQIRKRAPLINLRSGYLNLVFLVKWFF